MMDIFFNISLSRLSIKNKHAISEEKNISPGEREIETIFSFGNGYIGTRNSLEELYSQSSPGTFLAGFYEKDINEEFDILIKIPDWTRIQIFVEDDQLDLIKDNTLYNRRYIDLNNGCIVRDWKCADSIGRITSIKIIKYISLSDKHEMGKTVLIKPENYTGNLRILSGIDCNSADFNYLINQNIIINDSASVLMKSKFSDKEIMMLQKSLFNGNGIKPEYQVINNFSGSFEEWSWFAEIGKIYEIKSLMTVYDNWQSGHSLDNNITLNLFQGLSNSELLQKSQAGKMLNSLGCSHVTAFQGSKASLAASARNPQVQHDKERVQDDDFFETSAQNHVKKWLLRFNESQIKIAGNEHDQKHIDFALFHLINSGEFSGDNYSISARTLSGEAYKGHVFWDTEMYLLPFFTYTKPEIAKRLLLYRYNTLDGARKNAANEGFKGASYAWESTESGLEMAPSQVILPDGSIIYILSGRFENHISSDIAYAVWKYWEATEDIDFMINYGAEILFETARYCESLIKLEDDRFYHIPQVIGPDEYHEKIDDNAYTNYLVRNNFEIAIKAYNFLEDNYGEALLTIKEKIKLKKTEVKNWGKYKNRIYFGYDEKTKLFEQFKGFYDLQHIDLMQYEPRSIPMDVIIGHKNIQKTRIIKQADVLMFLFLFGEKFSADEIMENYEFYEPGCGHGSSLSPSIHSIIAARLGKIKEAYKYFLQNAGIDLDNGFGNAFGGIHIASTAGVWMSVIMGFAGMYPVEKGLIFDPHMPDEWESIEFSIKWRGQSLNIILDRDKISFSLPLSSLTPVHISLGKDNWKELNNNEIYYGFLKDKNWYWQD